MQISVESTGALERRMEVSVPKEQIEQAVDERLKQRQPHRQAQGLSARARRRSRSFASSSAPRCARKCCPRSCRRVSRRLSASRSSSRPPVRASSRSLRPGRRPQIPRGLRDLSGHPLKEVDGLAVTRPVAEVTEADIEAMLQNLREQRPNFIPVDRESRDGDRVTMDFEGKIDGEAFEGSKGDDVAVILGSGRMLKDFDAGITGAKAGEERAISVRYPDDHHNQSLAGKTADFTVRVKKVEEKAAAAARRRVLPRIWRGRGRHGAVAHRSGRQHASRAAREYPWPRQAAVARPAARSQPDRCAAHAGREPGARDADGHGAPHWRERCIESAAAGRFRRTCAPAGRPRAADRRTDPDPRPAARP